MKGENILKSEQRGKILHKITRQPCRKIYKIYHKNINGETSFYTLETVRIYILQLNCMDTLESVWIHQKLYGYTRNCMDTLETLWIHQKLYEYTRNCMDTLETLWIHQKLYEYTRNFMDTEETVCLDTLETAWIMIYQK